MKCRNCKEVMKEIPQGFDAISFLNPIHMMYCENKECLEFGKVTVVGIPHEIKDEKNTN